MEHNLTLGHYALKALLGRGRRSEIWLGAKGTATFALKCVSKSGFPIEDYRVGKEIEAEADVMNQLDHPNILKIHEAGESEIIDPTSGVRMPVYYLALEHAEGGDLVNLIQKTGRLSEALSRYYFARLLSALEYMHSCGLAHRDIKPDNVLLDGQLNPLLADYDQAGSIGVNHSPAGTYKYMAPEQHSTTLQYIGEKVDIFCMGVLLFCMMTGHAPFGSAKRADIHYRLLVTDSARYWKEMGRLVRKDTSAPPSNH
jgi:carbon catabolite-derepressing protein kinase